MLKLLAVLGLLFLGTPVDFPGSGVVQIMTKTGSAHGCVVEGNLLTAEHVAVITTASYEQIPQQFAWEDHAGNSGVARVAFGDRQRDVAILETDVPVGKGFKRAAKPPAPGEVVKIFGYARGDKDPLKPVHIKAKVIAARAGHLFFDATPGPGSSGACVLNEVGEVVAINVGAWFHSREFITDPEKPGTVVTGRAVLITDGWDAILKQEANGPAQK